MVIQNIGKGPAYDVYFEVLEDFKASKEKNVIPVAELGIIKYGVKAFAPDEKYTCWVALLTKDVFKEKAKLKVFVNTEYKPEW